jgi:hypothetical protein
LQALPHLYDVSRTSNSEARRLLREAIDRDASLCSGLRPSRLLSPAGQAAGLGRAIDRA